MKKLTTLFLSVDGELLNSIIQKAMQNFVDFEMDCLQETDDILEEYLKDVVDYVIICHNVWKIEEF